MNTLTFISCLGGVIFAFYILLSLRSRPTASIHSFSLGPFPTQKEAQNVAAELTLREENFHTLPVISHHVENDEWFVFYSTYVS